MDVAFGSWRISVRRTRPTDAELAAMYDDAAPSWAAKLAGSGYVRAYEDLFARLRDEGSLDGLRGGGRVLDCGIGSGALGLALSRAIGAHLELDGVDIAPRMLREAREAMSQAGIRAHMHHHDARDGLPFGDATFELAMSAHLLEHLDDPRTALGEMARVLRPGAPLVAVVTRRGASDSLLRLKWRHSSIGAARLVRWMGEAGLHDVRLYDVAGGGALPLRLRGIACVGMKRSHAREPPVRTAQPRGDKRQPTSDGGLRTREFRSRASARS